MITEIQQRLMDSIGPKGGALFNRALGLALYNGANPKEMTDPYHLALWFEGAHPDIKREFLDAFNELNDDLRVCDNCGRFMCEGYLLDTRYACSDECAIALYEGDEAQLREDIGDGDGDYFWTEW
jgi:hypothetical protein